MNIDLMFYQPDPETSITTLEVQTVLEDRQYTHREFTVLISSE